VTTLTLLVVDDRDDSREAIKAVLGEHRILEARSGAEALRILLAEAVAALLVDVELPDMTGFEVASLVRDRERTREIPILLMTAHTADRELVARAADAGAFDVLAKPLLPETLRAKIGAIAQLDEQRAKVAELSAASEELALLQLQLASERRYRNLAEVMPNIVWTALPDGTIDYFNRRWFEYTGMTTERAAGSFRTALHPSDAEPFFSAWQRALAAGVPHEMECRLQRADGTYRWHLCRAVPDRGVSGDIVAWLGSFTDIDDERRRREVLAEFKGTLDAVLDAVMIFDVIEWRMLYVNQGASALLGYSTDELMAMHPFQFTAQHDDTSLRDLLEPLLSGEQTTLTTETRFTRKDVRVVPVEVSFQLIRVNGGRVVAIARDITERTRARLEREMLYRETVEALRARDEFLSIASHELRTPLSALQLQIEMLLHPPRRDPTAVPSPEDIKRKLELAARQVDRLARLISELLDVTRITGGRLKLEREEADLVAITHDVIERFGADAAKAGSHVTLDATGPIVGVWDRMRLEQVVTNLLTNAFKFGAGKPIDVAVVRRDGTAVLTIVDHGIGISADDVERIFRRFEQAVSTRTFGGLGLGLYIVRGIVEAHGGAIHVDSKVNVGTTFTIELPLQPTEETREREERSSADAVHAPH
jgi:PAS domain S-box-containing protein